MCVPARPPARRRPVPSRRYAKQIEKAKKKWQKYQDQRNPPKAYEAEKYEDGTDEWTRGALQGMGMSKNAEKKAKNAAKKDKKPPKTD